jgi:hypothetical protein
MANTRTYSRRTRSEVEGTVPRVGGHPRKRDNALGGVHGKETKTLQSGVQS